MVVKVFPNGSSLVVRPFTELDRLNSYRLMAGVGAGMGVSFHRAIREPGTQVKIRVGEAAASAEAPAPPAPANPPIRTSERSRARR